MRYRVRDAASARRREHARLCLPQTGILRNRRPARLRADCSETGAVMGRLKCDRADL